MNRAKKTAELIAKQHYKPVEMVEEPLLIDISWGKWEGKTYMENFGDPLGGDYVFNQEKLNPPGGENFYAVYYQEFWT